MIIEAVGEDVNREGLQETPARVARMYQEIFSGLGQTAGGVRLRVIRFVVERETAQTAS